MSSQPSYTQSTQGNPKAWGPPGTSSTHIPSPSTPGEKSFTHPHVPSYRRRNIKLPVLAVIVTFLITLALIILVFIHPNFFKADEYDLLVANIYTFVLVILATLLATFIRHHLRILWIREVDRLLAEQGGAAGWDVLNKRWRTTLGIARIRERWGSFANIKIDLTYITAGLLISCITAGFNLYSDSRSIQYYPKIPDGRDYFCANITTTEPTDLPFWKLDGGKYYTVYTELVRCPTSEAETLFRNINSKNASNFAYSDMGVAVLLSALGVPASVYGWVADRDEAIISLSTQYQLGLLRTAQCVPVMQRNPISCRKGGSVQFSNTNNTMYATSANGDCIVSDDFLESDLNPKEQYSMVKGKCIGSKLGQGTITMGASGTYAALLANMIAAFGKVLFGNDEPCDGPAGYLAGSNARIALAALSSSSILREGDGSEGWSQTLVSGALDMDPDNGFSRRQSGTWAFGESQNALEDFLGVTAAMVASRIYSEKDALIGTSGSAYISSWRIGSGSLVALVYAVPPFVVLLTLMWRLWSLKRMEVRWKTSRLGDLVTYGRLMPEA
ncbi:MAG: hypothetical protein M1839_000294 [Geoglossum umbratile]|nr:MAG: hypothetical protein M1839_000294 [Geoglossum umbratile]